MISRPWRAMMMMTRRRRKRPGRWMMYEEGGEERVGAKGLRWVVLGWG